LIGNEADPKAATAAPGNWRISIGRTSSRWAQGPSPRRNTPWSTRRGSAPMSPVASLEPAVELSALAEPCGTTGFAAHAGALLDANPFL